MENITFLTNPYHYQINLINVNGIFRKCIQIKVILMKHTTTRIYE